MEVYTVQTTEEWNLYFPLLKEDARIGTTPELFVVGFDTEFISRSNFEESFSKSKNWVIATPNDVAVCTVQIASSSACLIIYLTMIGPDLPKGLISLLTNDCWVKAGVGVELDLKYLSGNYQLGHCSGGFEIRSIAILAGLQKSNLEYLYSTLTGTHVKKSKSIHDWSKDLTSEQLQYAVKDAIMSKRIFDEMIKPTLNFLNQKSTSDGILLNFKNLEADTPEKNFVGRLNEKLQSEKKQLANYEELPKDGSLFKTLCQCDGIEEIGTGRSKKDAKQQAAYATYRRLFEEQQS
jgi:hypothetical protein